MIAHFPYNHIVVWEIGYNFTLSIALPVNSTNMAYFVIHMKWFTWQHDEITKWLIFIIFAGRERGGFQSHIVSQGKPL